MIMRTTLIQIQVNSNAKNLPKTKTRADDVNMSMSSTGGGGTRCIVLIQISPETHQEQFEKNDMKIVSEWGLA